MPAGEAAIFQRYIFSSLDRLVALAATSDADALNWSPPAPNANSLATLITHTLGNAEENILETLGGQPVGRDRAGEFGVEAVETAALHARWAALRERLAAALADLDPSELDRPRAHPRRGEITGREVLIVVARHAAEHLGQAELTRDLYLASRTSGGGSDG